MKKIVVINGPNLNLIGRREPNIYGLVSLNEIQRNLEQRFSDRCSFSFFQSNHEGALIDFIQAEAEEAQGIIINPGALTHYGLSLRDALEGCGLPFVEVHLTNIHAREPFRRRSVLAAIAQDQIAGQGWQGYVQALEALVRERS